MNIKDIGSSAFNSRSTDRVLGTDVDALLMFGK